MNPIGPDLNPSTRERNTLDSTCSGASVGVRQRRRQQDAETVCCVGEYTTLAKSTTLWTFARDGGVSQRGTTAHGVWCDQHVSQDQARGQITQGWDSGMKLNSPPVVLAASRTVMFVRPAWERAAAAATPETPAPTITTSYVVSFACRSLLC